MAANPIIVESAYIVHISGIPGIYMDIGLSERFWADFLAETALQASCNRMLAKFTYVPTSAVYTENVVICYGYPFAAQLALRRCTEMGVEGRIIDPSMLKRPAIMAKLTEENVEVVFMDGPNVGLTNRMNEATREQHERIFGSLTRLSRAATALDQLLAHVDAIEDRHRKEIDVDMAG